MSATAAAAALAAALPPPKYAPTVEDADDSDSDSGGEGLGGAQQQQQQQQMVAAAGGGAEVPPYGRRRGWKPRRQEDFGEGGAYPECHVAQYPLEMGRKKTTSGGALALQVDAEGNVRYDAIVQQGRREGQRVQSQHKDLVPLSQRSSGAKASDLLPDRPDQQAVAECAQRTRLALEKIINVKISTAQVTHVEKTGGNSSYIRYTPGQQGATGQQRIIKMTDVVEDPLEPPRWKFKKVPKGPPSPPPPVLRSPPRKVTAQEQKEWMVPPSISNWKNNKGFTVPLDKRLAADGRGLQDVHINDGFAQFSEALNLAERHAREEVRQRSLMQQKLAAKEKAAREEHLRQLAQRAREERSGLAPSATPSLAGDRDGGVGGGDDDFDSRLQDSVPVSLGRRSPRDSRSRSRSRSRSYDSASSSGSGSGSDSDSDSEDADARQRDRLRAERRRERERELRMSNMGTEQRTKALLREQNRSISEKVALGLAKPSASGSAGEVDSRLFNQEKLAASYGDEDSYSLYDRPLLQGSSAAQAIYARPSAGSAGAGAGAGAGGDEAYGGGTAEGVEEELARNDRFGLGKGKAFQGAEFAEARAGPVLFEKDEMAQGQAQTQTINDPFAIDQFLDAARRGAAAGGSKREGLHEGGARRSKRPRGEGDD